MFYDIGLNHNDYIFEGYMKTNKEFIDTFGSVLSYKYVSVDEELEVNNE